MFFLAHYNLAIFSRHVRKALHTVSLVLLVRRETKMLVLPVGIAAKSLPIDLTGVNIAFKIHHENGGKVCGLLGRVPYQLENRDFYIYIATQAKQIIS